MAGAHAARAAVTPVLETMALPHGPALVGWRHSTRARRMSLRIDAARGAVIVTLPPRAGRRAGVTFLRSNADWVAASLDGLPGQTVLADGATVPVGGVPHRIVHRPAGGTTQLREDTLEVAGDAGFLPRRVREFLQTEAARRIGALARCMAAEVGVAPSRIVVRDMRTRWGSCSAGRVLCFSWRLVMAPPHVQHYLAAHEAAHLRHMHHQKSFWDLVELLTPHRREATDWLHRHGAALLRVG